MKENFKLKYKENSCYELYYKDQLFDYWFPYSDERGFFSSTTILLRDLYNIHSSIDIYEWCIDNLLVKEIPDGMYLTCDSDGYYTLYLGTINVDGFSRALDLESSTVEIITNHFELSPDTNVEQWLLNNLEIKEVD